MQESEQEDNGGWEFHWKKVGAKAGTRKTYGLLRRAALNHEDTDLEGLLKTKYQISIGLRRHVDASVWTFAITENVRNFDNTPDIGFQIGWAYSPAFMR